MLKNESNNIFPKIYLWLGIGLLLTFLTGYYLSENVQLLNDILINFGMWGLMITTLILTFIFKLFIKKLPVIVLRILYFGFAMLLGVTFGSIFYIYQLSSVILVFMMTSIIFILLSIYGYFTKKDLTAIGNISMFALIGIILCSLFNYFVFKNSLFEILISSVSALIFLIFIAYDIQKIKNSIKVLPNEKVIIYGAFELYLDFINLFLDFIRLFGKKK